MSKRAYALWSCLFAACLDPDTVSDSTVDRARIIAVEATPAEAAPGASVHYRAIVATPDDAPAATLRWAFCATPRGASDNTAASPACVQSAERPLTSPALELDATVPTDACALFGSETPSGRAENRADATGGYYQPLRVQLGETDVVVHRFRIHCALPNAPLSAAREYAQRYLSNNAPRIERVRVLADGRELDPPVVPAGTTPTVELLAGVDARESYLLYDARGGGLETRLEQLSATWFTSQGAFETEQTMLEDGPSANRLHLTKGATSAKLWVVLRDDRGASTVQTLTLWISAPP